MREFAEIAFNTVDLNWRDHIIIDPKYFRPTEVDALIGDASKIANALGWRPKTKWSGLAELMVKHDLSKITKSNI